MITFTESDCVLFVNFKESLTTDQAFSTHAVDRVDSKSHFITSLINDTHIAIHVSGNTNGVV